MSSSYVLLRGHALQRVNGNRGGPRLDPAGRGVCACGWTTPTGLTNALIVSAHRDHKLALLYPRR